MQFDRPEKQAGPPPASSVLEERKKPRSKRGLKMPVPPLSSGPGVGALVGLSQYGILDPQVYTGLRVIISYQPTGLGISGGRGLEDFVKTGR